MENSVDKKARGLAQNALNQTQQNTSSIGTINTRISDIANLYQNMQAEADNKIIANGIVLDDLTNITGWTALSGKCTVGADNTHGFKVTSIIAGGGGTFNCEKTTYTFDFTNTDTFDWVFRVLDVTKIGSLYLNFMTDAVNYYSARIFAESIINGKNTIRFVKADFTANGSPNWTNITRIRLTCDAVAGQQPEFSVDGFYANIKGLPFCILTFDDGLVECKNVVEPIITPVGYKACVGAVHDWVEGTDSQYLRPSDLKTLHDVKGWDIVSHGYTHTALTSLTDEQVIAEINNNRTWLNANGMTRASDYLIYPATNGYNAHVADLARGLGIKAARTNVLYLQRAPQPDDMLALKSVILGSSTTVQSVTTAIDKAILAGMTIIIYAHKITATPGASTEFSTANFQTIVNYLVAKKVPNILLSDWVKRVTNPKLTMH